MLDEQQLAAGTQHPAQLPQCPRLVVHPAQHQRRDRYVEGVVIARTVFFILRRVGSHGSGMARARRLAAFPVAGPKQMAAFMTTHSTLGAQFAGRISLGDAVCVAIRQAYEQWDGKGYPDHLRGEQICPPARLVQLASPVEVFSRRRGVEAAVTMARRHRGTQYDPTVVDLFCAHAPAVLAGLDQASTHRAPADRKFATTAPRSCALSGATRI